MARRGGDRAVRFLGSEEKLRRAVTSFFLAVRNQSKRRARKKRKNESPRVSRGLSRNFFLLILKETGDSLTFFAMRNRSPPGYGFVSLGNLGFFRSGSSVSKMYFTTPFLFFRRHFFKVETIVAVNCVASFRLNHASKWDLYFIGTTN